MCVHASAPIAFAPVWWEHLDQGEEPKCVHRRKATAISPYRKPERARRRKLLRTKRCGKTGFAYFTVHRITCFQTSFFFCMNRIPVFSVNFSEHLTKSREKRWHRSKAPCQMYQYALIDSSTGLGSTLYPSFLSNSLFSGGGKTPPPLTIINMVKNILSTKKCSLPFAKHLTSFFNSEKNLKNKLLKYLLFFSFSSLFNFLQVVLCYSWQGAFDEGVIGMFANWKVGSLAWKQETVTIPFCPILIWWEFSA